LCFGDAGLALTRAGLYQAAAPVADRSEAAQTEAFQTAMKIVLVRVTGRRSAEDDPALAPLVGNARRYVQQYRGAPDGQVWVSFDGPAIERWLTQNGQPLWGHERPTTFVWLAAQTGPQSGTVITADDTSELKAAIDGAAVFRGVPLLWPSAADVQRNRLDYASVSGAAPSTLAEIGRRFSNPDFDLDNVAGALGLSRRYVQQLIEETGKSFTEHVVERRLERALAMLSDRRCLHLAIIDIAFAAGFGDVSHFNRVFRRRFGETPSGVRALAIGSEQK